MNKFLLLALMVLLGVLAFALGLFSRDSSTALSQYVPNSVGEMFSKTKNTQHSTLKNTSQKSNENTTIAALVLPSSVDDAPQQATSVNQLDQKNLNTVKSTTSSVNTLTKVPESLIAEIQYELYPEPSTEAVESIKKTVSNVESENQALKQKLIALKEESKKSDELLEKLEKQYKEKLNAQKVLPSKSDDILKELEKQIQSLNH